MPRRNRRYRIPPSHYSHDTTYLKSTIATILVDCDVCHLPIGVNDEYWYIDYGGTGSPYVEPPPSTPNYICARCVHAYEPNGSLMAPYWVKKPQLSATNNIRTPDDHGWREYIDGISDEWTQIWASDLSWRGSGGGGNHRNG